jgi:hypothetical protein
MQWCRMQWSSDAVMQWCTEMQVMVLGGVGEEHSVMKLVLGQNNWYSVPPMAFPRVQVH